MKSDIRSSTTQSMAVTDFSVDAQTTDGPQDQNETTWEFSDFTQWFGYYKEIPELKKAIQTYGTWVVGQGYTTGLSRDRVILENITGMGEDDFMSILWNMLVMKKINGDSFAEIIRDPDTGTLINLKPLSPERMTIVVNRKGLIKEYRYRGMKPNSAYITFKPSDIFHLVNDRVADQIHGDSVVEALQWLIDSRQEAMEGLRKAVRRSNVRIVYVEEDDPTKLASAMTKYKDGVDKGDVVVLPGKRSEYEFVDLTTPGVEAFLAWIRYCENSFYKAVGVPKTLAGDAEGIPESGGKMVVFTHEPTYVREVTALESDIWNQLAIRITFKRQSSLNDNVQETEDKNINQTQAAQPSDTNI